MRVSIATLQAMKKAYRVSFSSLLITFALLLFASFAYADDASSTASLIVNTDTPLSDASPTVAHFYAATPMLPTNLPTNTIFSDDFDDNSIDTTQWRALTVGYGQGTRYYLIKYRLEITTMVMMFPYTIQIMARPATEY